MHVFFCADACGSVTLAGVIGSARRLIVRRDELAIGAILGESHVAGDGAVADQPIIEMLASVLLYAPVALLVGMLLLCKWCDNM